MPSQDDYLDSLLKNQDSDPTDTDNIDENESFSDDLEDDDALIENAISKLKEEPDSDDDLNLEDLDLDEIYSDIGILSDANEKMEAGSKVSSAKNDAAPDLEALSSMSEEEIEKLLSAGADSASLDKESLSDDEELLDMLNDADNDDLQDINEMLHRADNNEAVDESLLERDLDKENESGKLPGGENDLQNTLSEKEQRAQQKKLRKQERAEAKAAAKAEKAAAKAAAKAEKAAAKAAKKAGTAVAAGVPVGSQGENAAAKSGKKGSPNTLFDTSLLDSIVAGAGQAGSDGKLESAPEESEDINSGGNIGGASAALNEDDSAFSDFELLNTEEAGAETPEHDEPGPQKGGFFGKVLDFLTEDEEEDEENEGLQLSEENRDILNDLDNEESGAKKDKKKKDAAGAKGKAKKSKPKKKAPKKPKAAKKPKKPKPEKPKKEKVPEPEPLIPERKLTLKRMLPVILLGASLCAFIIVLSNISVDFADKQAAAEAYEAGDYQTCFQNLYGKKLNETEQLMFGRSESILYIRLWLREYEMFAEEGSEIEALDSLIQTVNDYPQLFNYAVQWNAGAEVAAGYQTVLSILSEKYGLTEEQAKQIAAERSDRKYTRMIVEIILGNTFNSLNGQTSDSEPEQQVPDSGSEQDTLQDVLPEEDDLGEGEFIGN